MTNRQAPMPDYVTLEEVADLFGVSTDTMRRNIVGKEGFPASLPWSKRPRRWLRQAVLNWKERQERQAGARYATSELVIHRPALQDPA